MEPKKKETRYITHLVINETPSKGLAKLYFYTATAEGINEGKYFWGTDNNSFDKKFIDDLVNNGQITALTEPKELENGKCLWIDSSGKVYNADIRKPYEKLDFIAAPLSFSKVVQEYNKSIGHENVPHPENYYAF